MFPDVLKLAGLLLVGALAWLICDDEIQLKRRTRMALGIALIAVCICLRRL